MGRVSFAKKDLGAGGFIRDGNLEVVSAGVCVHQYPQSEESIKKGESPSDPVVAMRFGVYRLDDQLNRITEQEEDVFWPILWPKKENKQSLKDDKGNFIFAARPAKAANADDPEPEDLGNIPGVEGNCLLADDDYKVWNESPWGRMVTSLEEKAFKPEINARGFAPDYVGMKFHVKTIELPKTATWKKAEAPTATICDKIHVQPGGAVTGAAATATTKKKKDAEAPAGATTAGAPAGTAAPGAETNGSAEFAACKEVFKTFITANKGKTMTRAEMQAQIGPKLMGAQLPMKVAQKYVNEQLKPMQALGSLAFELGFEVSDDEKSVTFTA